MVAFCQFSRFLRVGTGLFHQHEEDWEEINFFSKGVIGKGYRDKPWLYGESSSSCDFYFYSL